VQSHRVAELIRRVSGVSGISLSAVSKTGTTLEDFEFRISGLEEPNGLSLKLFRTPLGVAGVIRFDLFSQDLIKKAESSYRTNRDEVSALFSSITEPATLTVRVNDSLLTEDAVERTWNSLDLRWFFPDDDSNDEWEIAERLLTSAIPTLFDFLTGFGTPAGPTTVGEVEGAVAATSCGRYKRSATNRAACLKHFGAVCKACGLKPEDSYGDEGPSIMHVHHLVPLSAMESPKALSPIEELVPLCPNCHNFAHKKSPPYTPEEIRERLAT